jgi:hypothetical protein
VALAHDPACPPSSGIKDQQAPAAIVPADLRAGQVDSTISFFRSRVIAEERAGLGTFPEDAPVAEERYLVRVNCHGIFFTSILVPYKETVIPIILLYDMNQPKMTAAFPALTAFKRHSYHPVRIQDIILIHLNPNGTGQGDPATGINGNYRFLPARDTHEENSGRLIVPGL